MQGQNFRGQMDVVGNLALRLMNPKTAVPARELTVREIIRYGMPQFASSPEVRAWRFRNQANLWRGARRVLAARALGVSHVYGAVSLVVGRCACGAPHMHLPKPCPEADWIDFGLASLRVVTTAGVGYIVDAFQNSVELEDMKYHGIGTGSTAEAVGDTALVTELTTQYSVDNTRATGSTTEGASANIYRTVGTVTVDASVAAVEHGVLSNATVGSGVLLDRTVFSVINLSSGDSIQATYDFTLTAGS